MSVDVAELEIVVFDAGGFCFGTEVSQIISIDRSLERMGQMDESISFVDLSVELALLNPGGSSGIHTGITDGYGDRKRLLEHLLILLVDTATGLKGVYVESVRDVAKVPLEQIEPLPEFLKSRIYTDSIWGIGKLGQELVLLLDLDRYLEHLLQSEAYKNSSTD